MLKRDTTDQEFWHILPTNDSDEHSEGLYCKCNPRIKHTCDHVFVIHNSFDGREAVEVANEILNNPSPD
jgi:hypothetical protein